MRHKYLWAGSIIGVIIALDQYTKYLVDTRIRRFDILQVVPGFFNLTNVRNRGAAFSILSGLPDRWRVLFFVAVTMVAVVVIAFQIRKNSGRLLVVAFSLIIGGAIGNVIDRIRYGEVLDFIQIYLWKKIAFLYPWPSFNIADSAISAGVGLLVVDMLFRKNQEPSTK